MFICAECNDSFLYSKVFLRHISLSHRFLSVFKCGEKSCLRTYSSFDSFRKHINSKHTENVEQKKHHLQQKRPKNTNSETYISLPSSSNIDLIDEMSSSSNNTDLIDFFDNTNDTDSFISNVTKNSFNSSNVDRHIYFAAKLYHYLDIPRCRAESIINVL